MRRVWVGVVGLAVVVMVFGIRALAAPGIEGNWQGALITDSGSLQVLIHVQQDKDGRLTGTLDSPDQQVTGVPMSTVTYNEPDLHLTIERFGCVYDGKISKDGSEIAGDWKQQGLSLPLTFKRVVK